MMVKHVMLVCPSDNLGIVVRNALGGNGLPIWEHGICTNMTSPIGGTNK